MQEFRFSKKAKWIAVALWVGVFNLPAAHAITTLKQVQISNGSQIDLLFDGKVQRGQIHTEFLNDIIQLNIQDVSVYPAKISSVNGGSLTKIFAYQYAPRLVRCRLTVKGKAEDYKDKLDIKVSGRILTVRMQGETPVAKAKVVKSEAPEALRPASPPDEEERALLSRVMAAAAPLGAAQPTQPAQPAQQAQEQPAQAKTSRDSLTLSAAAPAAAPAQDSGPSTESLPIHLTGETAARLGGAKPLPSPFKIFGKLGIVLLLFGLLAFALKRYARGRTDVRLSNPGLLQDAADKGGWLGAIGRIAKKGLSRDGKMIEVLSTHYLGPKKSIAVVRVAGRVLVLGVSNESINLITQLSDEDAAQQLGGADGLNMDALDLGPIAAPRGPATVQSRQAPRPGASATPAAGNAIFEDLLHAERGKPAFSNPSGPAAYGAKSSPNVRAQIRSRLEGLKQL